MALFLLAGSAGLGFFIHTYAAAQPASTDAPVAALSPFIEVHSHMGAKEADASIEDALRAMPVENAAKIIFLPLPFTPGDPARFDDEVLIEAEKNHRDKFAFLGGGGTLNVMIQESMRSGNAGPEVQKKFRERAEEIMRQGAVGFGEMTSEHFATSPTAYYEHAPADHPLFLILADISAEHGGAPIDLHMEAVPQPIPLPDEMKAFRNPPQIPENISAFERLLRHNPRARIVWAHAGSDFSGYRTVDLNRRLLKAHPNLFMEIKIDPLEPGKNSPLANGASGPIRPEWRKLFEDFPDRFVIGTDQHYPQPEKGPQRWQAVVLLFNQLPADLRREIGIDNPTRIYNLK
jgi:predicted TIM-barrel fold metal-dependent hydrolase